MNRLLQDGARNLKTPCVFKRLNEAQYGKKFKKEGQEETRRMLGCDVCGACLQNTGRVTFERVYYESCAFGRGGKEGKKLLSSSDLRFLQFVNQHRCDGTHEQSESMDGNATHTDYYIPAFADMVLEAWYPQA